MNRTARSSSAGWIRTALLAVASVAAIAVFVAYQLRPVVETSPVLRGLAINAVPASVEVRAEHVYSIQSEVGGRVRRSAVVRNQRVRADEVLVELDTTDVGLDIARISSELQAARRRLELGSGLRGDLENARQALTDAERQMKAGAISAADFERQSRALRQLEQRLELDEVNLRLQVELLETSLRQREHARDKMTVRAPADGLLTEVLVFPGDLVGGGSVMATLLSERRVVEGRLTEENFAAVRPGQRATVRLLSTGAEQFDARVTRVVPAANPTTQRYALELEIALPPGRELVHGTTGEASIVIEERSDALIVPRTALRGNRLWVVAAGRVQERQVKRGFESLNKVEILDGVTEGELVVVEPPGDLAEGKRVRARAAAGES